ncbi:hypothetical protein V8E36_008478 [Tilletia maclaganii]
MPAAAAAEKKVQSVHLVVLNHGLWGSAANLRHICRSLITKHPGSYLAPKSTASSRILTDRERERIKKEDAKRQRTQAKAKEVPNPDAWETPLLTPEYDHSGNPPDLQLVLLNTRSNIDRTYDGLDFCAERVRAEIDAEVTRLRTATSPPCHIARVSIIGYSLGGLISRYLVALLHSRHFFTLVPDAHIPAGLDEDTVRILRTPPVPVQFVTLATPHLGMLPPSSGFRRFAAFIGARALSRTGEQLFLKDSGWEAIDEPATQGKRPSRGLIEAMSTPDSLFLSSLQRFQKVVFYANAVNDPTVPFRTAALYDEDPFLLDGLQIEIEPSYPGLLHSFSFPDELPPQPSLMTRIRKYELPFMLNPKRNPLRFPLNYLIIPLFPIAFPVFLVLVLTRFRTESGDSRKRIRELRRLWREERALEAAAAGGSEGDDGVAESGEAGSRSPALLEEVGRRMSSKPGVLGSAATSGTATPVVSATSTSKKAPSSDEDPASSAEPVPPSQAPSSWNWSRLFKQKPGGSRPQGNNEAEEEHEGERNRIRALLQRVEEAAEMGDGSLEGNQRRGDDANVIVTSTSSNPSASSSFRTKLARIPTDRLPKSPNSSSATKLFPLQHDFIAHVDAALGDKLERRLAYFPRVINAHPIIIVRMPGTELCKMGEGVVRHLVDTFVV